MAIRNGDTFIFQDLFHGGEPYPRVRPMYIAASSLPKAHSTDKISYLAERYGYSEYMFRGDRSTICHPYFEPGRIALRKEMSVVPFQQKSFSSYNRPMKYRRYRSKTENSYSPEGTSNYSILWKDKTLNEANIFVKSENLDKPEENVGCTECKEAELSVVNYCLDSQTQYIINRLQNDFRLTKKYKTFVMYEMPLISDFKPTPSTTTNKFHDRFKCLFKQLLDEKDLNVDDDSNLENLPENEKLEVSENADTENTN